MRQHLRATLVTFLALSAGCYQDVVHPSGPVTVTFSTPTYPGPGGAAVVSHGTLVMDGVDTLRIPEDSIAALARGQHSLSALLDVAYIPTTMSGKVDPSGRSYDVFVPVPASCRIYAYDAPWCGRNSAILWRGHQRTWCPANDFGDFCSWFPDSYQLGLSWPADNADNQYLAHARLLVGAVLGPDAPMSRGGDTLAMALLRAGDYAPRVPLHPFASDTSRWQGEVVTDMRRLPSSGSTGPILGADDRAGDNFGLAVRTTYSLPAGMPDAILVRFDVTNVSSSADYRRVHPEEPATGHTLYNVYLAPTLDPAIACGPYGCSGVERADDNATLLASDSLLVAYDEAFSVPEFGGGYDVAPGLLGVRLVDGPAGTSAKAIVFDAGTTPDFITAANEHTTYRLLSAGRAGSVDGCTDQAPAALLCAPETESDIRMAWSVGPIASLAPGESTHLTIAILFASPDSGAFTSGTNVAPGNVSASAYSDTTRALWKISSKLRALGGSVRGVVVDTTSH
ncbi:MAG: hypothetical protein HOQ30_03910 [Gemmatimonadaceae bacterium]|nr:hypothetical protein [Gemmatimonadaceae bacterium]NUQ92106.1 hypothetical protein [Gemmatimonadaceae bacterium]NUR33132.1 hypothetical protein [Gemmatimonadaceae bacterium]